MYVHAFIYSVIQCLCVCVCWKVTKDDQGHAIVEGVGVVRWRKGGRDRAMVNSIFLREMGARWNISFHFIFCGKIELFYPTYYLKNIMRVN